MTENQAPRDDLLLAIERLDALLLRDRRASSQAPTEPGRAAGGALSNELLDRFKILCETSALLNAPGAERQRGRGGEPILETVVDIAVELTRARRGLLFLKQENGSLDVLVARDEKRRAIVPLPRDYPKTIVDRVCETREPVLVPEMTDQEPLRSASVRELRLGSVLCVPLAAGAVPVPRPGERRRFPPGSRDELLGVIYLDSDVRTRGFREEDLNIFRTLANHATTALLRERLYRRSITDPLTRLLTRAHFERELEDAFARFERTRSPFAILLADADGMKRVNDRLGLHAGDSVLRDLAAVASSGMRAGDLSFRHGGDELAFLVPETDERGALVLAEKLRERVQASAFYGGSERVTVSIGMAASPAHATSARELVRKADQALARAKERGGNRVEAWAPDLGPRAPGSDRLAGVLTGSFAEDARHTAILVNALSRLALSRGGLGEVSALVVDEAIEATLAERGALLVADGSGQLTTVVSRGRGRRPLELGERFSRSVPERVQRSGEPVFVIASHEGEQPGTESSVELGITTILCVPLAEAGKRIGVLYLDSRKGTFELVEASLPFVAALARHLAPIVEAARLRERS